MKLVDAILSNLAERRRLKREGRFTELTKQELDARKRRAEMGLHMGFRNSEEVERATAPFMARGNADEINPRVLQEVKHVSYVPVQGPGEVVADDVVHPEDAFKLDASLLSTGKPLNPSSHGTSSRMFMFGKALPPNLLRPRPDINDPHATVSGSVDSHKFDVSIATPRDPRQVQQAEPTGRTDIDPEGHSPGKQPFTASFIGPEVDVEIFVRKRYLGGKSYRLRRKRGPRNYRHVQIKPKTYMHLTRGKHRGQPLSNIGGTRRYGIYGSREDILSGNVKIVERYQGDSQRSLNEIIPEHIQKINASLTSHCRQLAESALATMSPEERQLSVDRFRDAIMAERPGWARKRVARNNQFLGKPVIRPVLGSRVRWLDAYGNVSTLAGTVNHIHTGVPGEHATVETVYTVRKDDGDELETHAGNLIIIEDEL